ncbi:MAG TPA: hypothetical protein VIV60_20390, partial [Polyangiaceae bacterium]
MRPRQAICRLDHLVRRGAVIADLAVSLDLTVLTVLAAFLLERCGVAGGFRRGIALVFALLVARDFVLGPSPASSNCAANFFGAIARKLSSIHSRSNANGNSSPLR